MVKRLKPTRPAKPPPAHLLGRSQVEALGEPPAAVRRNPPFPSQDQVAAAAANGRAEGVAGAHECAAPGRGWASLAVGVFWPSVGLANVVLVYFYFPLRLSRVRCHQH